MSNKEIDQSTRKVMATIAPDLEKFSPVASSSENHKNINIKPGRLLGSEELDENLNLNPSSAGRSFSNSSVVSNSTGNTITHHYTSSGTHNNKVVSSLTADPNNPSNNNSLLSAHTYEESSTTMSGISTPIMGPTSVKRRKYGKIGICAMDAKVLSKPCREILNRLIKFNEFETVIFGEKSILDELIEEWPNCDFMISFFSNGFPLDKAIDYANLRKPFLINDLVMQKVLWDRRLCLRLLEASGVRTPYRLEISRDGGPGTFISDQLKQKLISKKVNVDEVKEPNWKMLDADTLEVDGKLMTKPFVEKPVDGEDHNVYIYFHTNQGGGGRRLFRKVGNKSSEFDPGLTMIRTSGSFIYEQFMDTDNLEDVKAYTVGPNYCHAETRKSPVVDGIVRRNTKGKELRYITQLTEEEKDMARKVSTFFDQTICGFDILRANNQSYVIDVNGFSFVKDNIAYYDDCAQILRDTFKKNSPYKEEILDDMNIQDIEEVELKDIHSEMSSNMDEHDYSLPMSPSRISIASNGTNILLSNNEKSKWIFKGSISVIRHADRTPKQKIKYSFTSPIFLSLLKQHREEVIIRQVEDLEFVLKTIKLAEEQKLESHEKLFILRTTLEKKIRFPGTKIQLKPVFDKANKEIEKVQFILKWGGEPTHSAQYQACDLGETTRQNTELFNKDALKNVKVYSSSERRVVLSAQLWACSFLQVDELPDDFITIRKDLLDDSNAAKDLMDKVKKKIKPLLRQGIEPPKQFSWPPKYPDPYYITKRVVELMNYHQKIMEYNFEMAETERSLDKLQSSWCCSEDAFLFIERWDKLFKEFATFEKVDPSKISELYDTMKFDALHNREFLEHIFKPPLNEDLDPEKHADLLKYSKNFFKSPVLCDTYPINVLAMNNFQLPSSSHNSSSASSSGSNIIGAASATSAASSRGQTTKQTKQISSVSSSPPTLPMIYNAGWVLKKENISNASSSTFDDRIFGELRELYKLTKVLFDFVCPQEYGIENNEKLDIGLLTSLPLAKQIIYDIEHISQSSESETIAYFTKESHIYTLLNIIYELKLPLTIERNALPELDYLSQIVFELYEMVNPVTNQKKHSVKMYISPGCHTQDPLDVELDSKHYISNIPKIALTKYLDISLFMQKLKSRFSRVSLPKKFIPVNISSPLSVGKVEQLKKDEKE